MTMRALELFAGIGGIALAEQMAGIEVAGLCEFADYPRSILRKHWPDVPLFKDVKKLDREQLENGGVNPNTIDIISGGFPCQPFSQAGKRRGTEDDRDLWPEMFRIIKELRPTWIVGENVANFANMELDRTLSNLEDADYQTRAFVLPACAVDAPHQRLRTFIVAHSNSKRHIYRPAEQHASEVRQRALRDLASSRENVLDHADSKRWETGSHHVGKELAHGEAKWKFGSTVSKPARWAPEPGLGRVADGVPNRLDRIKALGNAVVPYQVLPIFQTIVKIEEEAKYDD